ncbi:MAG: ribosome silencing factor [Spirochaetes bacterium]|nr:ribosome silencing factor [Spirochaetota bacterium]
MEDLSDKKDTNANAGADDAADAVKKVAEFINDFKGINTVALDLRYYNAWTDFFIITTASSVTHLRGMYNNIQEKLQELSIEPFFRQKKIDNENWVLIDCGYFVIHLMDKEHREFYELEKLWFNSEIIYRC